MGNTLQVERLGNVKDQSVLCLKGPLSRENLFLFQNAILCEEGFSTVILDLSGVPYIDSTALGALVTANVLPESGQTSSVFWCQRASIENVQNHQSRIALPYVPDVRGGDRRADSGWRSLVKNHILSKRSPCPHNAGKYALARN
jgi:ABC-type transporter Mla MlaB component